MTNKKNPPSDGISQEDNIVNYTMFFTEKQAAVVENLVEKLGVADMSELFDKMITLMQIYGNAVDNGYDLAVVDMNRLQTKTTGKGSKQIVSLKGNAKAFAVVTTELEEQLGFNRQIKQTNNFGFPVQDFQA